MRFLSLRRSEPPPPAATCRHPRLVPRVRGPQALEDDARAMGFVCHDCHREFLPYVVRDRRVVEG
ncbi:MAG: hypothetical protein FJZ92_02925 [Chloroflexi bacterium]|nr:hypothetical protein [Chloroflexota bacterium]